LTSALHEAIRRSNSVCSPRAFLLGVQELDRALSLAGAVLSKAPTPFVTTEDILLAKLRWFRGGGWVSEPQGRDSLRIVRACGAGPDLGDSEESGGSLLEKALSAARSRQD
jgi:hypothetical protein